MSLIKTFCPYCGRVVQAGQRCVCRKAKRKATSGDKTRQTREPWRKHYTSPAYLKARQIAIERACGRCVDCGKVCATKRNGHWYTADLGGETDHIQALCDGGTDSADNLALRCKSCHGKRDANRRKQNRALLD